MTVKIIGLLVTSKRLLYQCLLLSNRAHFSSSWLISKFDNRASLCQKFNIHIWRKSKKRCKLLKTGFGWVSLWCAGMHVLWRIVRTFRHFCANCQEINIMCRHMLYFCWNCAQKCFNCPYLSFAQARHLKSSSYLFHNAVFTVDLD